MKALPNVTRRALAITFALALVFTTFFFTDLGFDLGLSLRADATVTSSPPKQPSVTFYVPEAIYLSPTSNTSFQYYVDSSDAAGTLVANAKDTSGNIYFNAEGATNVKISCQGIVSSCNGGSGVNWVSGVSSPGSTINAAITEGTLSSAPAVNSGTTFTWVAEYVIGGRTYYAYAYTFVYNPFYGNGSAVQAQKATRFKSGTSGRRSIINMSCWITGIHEVTVSNSGGSADALGGMDMTYPPLTNDSQSYPINNSSTADWTNADQLRWVNGHTGYSGYWEQDANQSEVEHNGYYMGRIWVDSSRYSNLNEVPNLRIGLDLHEMWTSNNNYWEYSLGYYNRGSTRVDNNAITLTRVEAQNIMGWRFVKTMDAGVTSREMVVDLYGYARSSGYVSVHRAYTYLSVVAVNKANIRQLVRTCTNAAYREDLYTADSWSAYETALINAYSNLGNPKATQNEVNEASYALDTAVSNLTSVGTRTYSIYHVLPAADGFTYTVNGTSYTAANGAITIVESGTFAYGSDLSASPNSYPGYTCSDTQRTFDYQTSDLTYTYNYTALSATITLSVPEIHVGYYDLESTTVTVYYGQKLNLPSVAIDGWTFNGWYSDVTYKNKVNNGTYIDYYSTNKILYAKHTCFFAGGHGSQDDAFQISNQVHIDNIDNSSIFSSAAGIYFKQINDITYAINASPLSEFKGHYDGQNYKITIPSSTTITGTTNASFFGDVTNATISNITFDIGGSLTSGGTGNAGIVGSLSNSTMTNIQVTFNGALSVNSGKAGVMAAQVDGSSFIVDCSVTFTGGAVNANYGAFIGVANGSPTLRNTWTFVKVAPTNFTTAGSNNTMTIGSGDGTATMTYSNGVYLFLGTPNTGWSTLYRNKLDNSIVPASQFYSPEVLLTGANYEICFVQAVNISGTAGGTVVPSGSLTFTRGETENISVSVNEGYHFDGFTNTTDGTITQTEDGYLFTMRQSGGNITAVFDTNSYTIRFNDNDDAVNVVVPIDMVLNYGQIFSIPTMVPVNDGFTFVCWNTKADGSGNRYNAAQSGLVNFSINNGDIVNLYAIWSRNSYTVTFDADGGSYVAAMTGVEYGSLITFPSSTKTGYSFSYWQDEQTGVNFPKGGSVQIFSEKSFKAIWNAITYTVAFNANGGTDAPDSITATYDIPFALPSADNSPLRAGYEFFEWNTVRIGSGTSFEAGQMVDVNLSASAGTSVTLYAQWTAKEYTVSWNLNGGNIDGNTDSLETTVEYDAFYLLPGSTPQRANYIFNGWFTETSGGVQVTSNTKFTTAGDATVYAQWAFDAYTIVYSAGAANVTGSMANTVASYGSTFALPTNAYIKVGYTFMGWATAEGGAAVYDDCQSVSDLGNITLYATWIENSYSVSYDTNGGTGSLRPSTGFKMGSSKTLRSYSGTRSGYKFAGWARTLSDANNYSVDYLNAATLTVDAALLTYAVDTSITLYAVWYPCINITWNLNGGNIDGGTENPVTVGTCYGEEYVLPAGEVTRAGYVFDGWYTNITSGSKVDGSSLITAYENITLFAHWNKSASVEYTINHYKQQVDGNYPSEPNQITTGSATLNAIGNATTIDYDGFTVDVERSTLSGEVTVEPSLVLSVYYKRSTYTVTFKANGGVGNDYTQSFVFGETKELLPNTFTRTGYSFGFWAATPTGTTGLGDKAPYTMGSENASLYAAWSLNNYTITFNSSGGSAVAEITAPYGSNISAPVNPEFTGHTFIRWYLDDESTAYSFTTMPAQNITLTALWTGDRYTLSYNGNGYTGGTLPASSNEYYQGNVTLPSSDIVLENSSEFRKFVGWTDGTNSYVAGVSFNMPADDVTLTAVWSANYYTLREVINEVSGYFSNECLPASSTVDPLYAAGGSLAVELNSAGLYPLENFDTGNLQINYTNACTVLGTAYSQTQQAEITLAATQLRNALNSLSLYSADYDDEFDCLECETSYHSELMDKYYPSCEGTHSFNDIVFLCRVVTEQAQADSIYTAESVQLLDTEVFGNVSHGVNGIYYDIIGTAYKMPSQETINEAAASMSYFYHSLELKGADYSVVTDVISVYLPQKFASVSYANLGSYFTVASVSAVNDVYNSVNWDLKIVEQSYVDAFAEDLTDAVDGLVPLKANYSALFSEIASIPFNTEGFEYPSTAGQITSKYNNWVSWATSGDIYDSLDISYLELRFTAASLAEIDSVLSTVQMNLDIFSQTDVNDIVTRLRTAISALELKSYSVIYKNNNGTDSIFLTQSGYYGDTRLAPESEPTRQGYEFAGWKYDNGNVAVTSGTFTENLVILASWNEKLAIVPSDGTTTVVNDDISLIYGLEQRMTLENLDAYIEVLGSGYIELENYTTFIGTGTVIKLISSETHEVTATYTVVIVGDVNGDGTVNAADQTAIKKAASGKLELDGAFVKAADINRSGDISSADYTLIKSVLKGTVQLDQTATLV